MWKVDYNVIYSCGVLRTRNGSSQQFLTFEAAMIVIGATEIWPSDQKTRATKMFTTFFFLC